MPNTIRLTLQCGQNTVSPAGLHKFKASYQQYADVIFTTRQDGLSVNAQNEIRKQMEAMVGRLCMQLTRGKTNAN